MTALQIFIAVMLKGIIVAVLFKLGWWPDWEKRAFRREEHQRVIKAYEAWVAQTGHRPMLDHEGWRKMEERRGLVGRESSRRTRASAAANPPA